MPVREILQMGNPLLWEKSGHVEEFDSEETRATITDLSDTLKTFRDSHGFGRGIAAPQIGILKRVIYIRMQDMKLDGPFINPEIVWADPKEIELWDNCFSLPDLVVKVSRAIRVKVRYIDKKGNRQELDASGDLSELLQHEIDHLGGILAVQRAVSPTAFMTFAEWRRQGRPMR